ILSKHLHPDSVYHDIVKHYGAMVGINTDVHGFCVHALRATAATNALARNADIAKVQEWLGHANIATTRLYDRRQSRPAHGCSVELYDSNRFRVVASRHRRPDLRQEPGGTHLIPRHGAGEAATAAIYHIDVGPGYRHPSRQMSCLDGWSQACQVSGSAIDVKHRHVIGMIIR